MLCWVSLLSSMRNSAYGIDQTCLPTAARSPCQGSGQNAHKYFERTRSALTLLSRCARMELEATIEKSVISALFKPSMVSGGTTGSEVVTSDAALSANASTNGFAMASPLKVLSRRIETISSRRLRRAGSAIHNPELSVTPDELVTAVWLKKPRAPA